MDFGKKNLECLKEAELINQIMSSSENVVPATDTTSETMIERGFTGKIFSPIILLTLCI